MKIFVALNAAVGAAFCACAAAGSPLSADEIARKVCDDVEADVASYKDYVVSLTSVTKDKEGKEMYRVAGTLYAKKPDKSYFKLAAFYENGEKKDPPKDKDNKGKKGAELKSPFEEKYIGDYAFALKGTEAASGKDCYKLTFAAPKKGEGYAYGTAWVDAATFDLVKVSGKLYVQPEHCSDSAMTMYFSEFDGRTMVRQVDMYARASFLLFVNKDLYVAQTFAGYQFDQGLSDALFQ